MDAVFGTLFVFDQATLGKIWVAALALVAIGSLIFALYRCKLPWRDLRWVAAMPVPWVLLSMWAQMNRAPPGVYNHLEQVVTPLVLAQFVATLGLSGLAIFKAKGARLIVFLLAVINAWFAFFGGLLTAMMVTGSWM